MLPRAKPSYLKKITIKAVQGIAIVAENQKVVTTLKFHTLLSREKTI
jgi:hypothetical protein